jgi:site-specific recombinase XerD
MDIVNDFNSYLLSQKKPAGAVTIKNYLADVRKFTIWYEKTYQTSFTPDKLTYLILEQYKHSIENPGNTASSFNSVKRYFSSLRKLASFMLETNLIQSNPFIKQETKQVNTDPFYLKSFRNSLAEDQASKLTIKNYINDVKQFIEWLQKVTEINNQPQNSSLLDMIDKKNLEEYKGRLLHEAKLSPVSINRKLSSIRRYIHWLEASNIVSQQSVQVPIVESEILSEFKKAEPVKKELPLIALQGIAEVKKPTTNNAYSPFGPVRLAQKSTKAINLGLDLLIFNHIANAAQSIQYFLWKNSNKVIFAPVIDILENAHYVPKGISIKTIIPKQLNLIPPRSANRASVIAKVSQYRISSSPTTIQNFTKALYAPLEISTKQMDWTEKLWHTMRYKRPQWYKRYHSYSFVSYLHFAVMMIITAIAGCSLYMNWINGNGIANQAVLAAQETSPPRTLSFQGRLLNNTNTPITVETPLRFALYNNPTATGAAMLWSEKQDIKPNQNGNFTATLGTISRLNQQLFTDNPNLYIGIAIGDNNELLPRQQIPTANYAANSQTVEGMKPITDSPDKAQNVLLALDSSGNLTIGGTTSPTFRATGGNLTMSGQALLLTTNPGSNGNIEIVPDGSGIVDIQKPIQNTSNTITPSGILGAVDIEDTLSVRTNASSESALVLNQIGSGDIISGRSNGVDKFRLDNGGNAYLAGNIILGGDTIDSTSTAFDVGGTSVKHLTLGSSATVLTLGDSSGITSIRNSLAVQGTTSLTGAVNAFGLITANGGLTIAKGQTLAFTDFTPGAIPFIGGNNQLTQDISAFSWNDTNKTFNVLGSLCVNSIAGGTCTATAGTITAKTLNTTGTADLAENYVSAESLDPGDVVAAESGSNSMAIIKSTIPYQKEVMGVVSTNPGITLNSDAIPDYEHPNVYPLALQGRVPVKVSSINGSIKIGDALTSSSIPGVAMLASASGQTIGKALEVYANSDTSAVGKIMAFVNLSYYQAPAVITTTGNVSLVTPAPTKAAPALEITQELSASDSAGQMEASAGADLIQSDNTATTSASIYNSIASPSATASSDASLKESSIPTPAINTNLETNSAIQTNFSSLSDTQGKLTYIPNLKSDYATFSNGLIALGPSSLTDVAVSDMVIINNNLKITSDSIDTIATDLNIQPLRQGNILLEGGLVAVDTQGNLAVKGNATFAQNVTVDGEFATGVIAPIPNEDLTVNLKNKTNQGSNMVINNATGNHIVQINQQGDITASGEATFNSIASQGFSIIRGAEADASNTITVADGSGGKGIIAAHETERTIITPYVTSHSLIYVTATSNTGSIIPYVARQTPEDPQGGTKGSFTIEIPTAITRDISFNWWIVN